MLCLHVSGTTTHIPHLQRAQHQRGRYVCVVRLVEPNVVRDTCIVHVGGPRCVTWSIDQSIQIHSRTTWGVNLIRANFFHRFLVCLTLPLRSILSLFLQCSTRYKVHAWKLGEPVECMPCQNALFQPSVNDTGELVIVFRICYLFDQILLEYSKVYLLIQWCVGGFFSKIFF